jgi:hypothetical protein
MYTPFKPAPAIPMARATLQGIELVVAFRIKKTKVLWVRSNLFYCELNINSTDLSLKKGSLGSYWLCGSVIPESCLCVHGFLVPHWYCSCSSYCSTVSSSSISQYMDLPGNVYMPQHCNMKVKQVA